MHLKRRLLAFTILLFLAQNGRGQSLGVALNATNLTWTTSGSLPFNAVWVGQATTSHDGVAAAASRHLSSSGQSSTLQTTVIGPGTMSFWAQVVSANYSSTLSFKIDGITQTNIANFPFGWFPYTYWLGAGSHTLQWVLTAGGSPVNSAAYVDEVDYAPGETAPIITKQPQSRSQVFGLNSTFAALAGGTPPLTYQWQHSGTNLPGANGPSLTVTNLQSANVGSYALIVSNSLDFVTSSNATLEFGEVALWGQDLRAESFTPPGLTNITTVGTAGPFGFAFRDDGTLLQWGADSAGQEVVPPPVTNIVYLAGGYGHELALLTDGTVVAWGVNNLGQTNVPPDLTNVVAIAAGVGHNVALKADGTVVAWGWNNTGQTNVPSGLANVTTIAAGDTHCVALRDDGTLAAWGNSLATNVPSSATNVTGIAAGGNHSLAVEQDGTVVPWGYSGFGLGTVPAAVSNVVAVAAGDLHDCVLRADGTVLAWGANTLGQASTPTALTNVQSIAASGNFTLALVGNGPPVLQVQLTNPVLSSNGFKVSLPSNRGRVYRLEYKDSITGTIWSSLPLVAGTGTILTLTDPNPGSSSRFYRVRQW